MTTSLYTKALLTIIALALLVIACNHFIQPTVTAEAATNCWTNQPGCKGTVTISIPSTDKTSWSYTIWHGTTGGRENFVLRPGESHTVQVQYPDTYTVVAGSSGVPTNAGPPGNGPLHVCNR